MEDFYFQITDYSQLGNVVYNLYAFLCETLHLRQRSPLNTRTQVSIKALYSAVKL